MNVREAAASLCVSPETIRRHVRAGKRAGQKRGRAHAWEVEVAGHYFTVRALAECANCSVQRIHFLIGTGAIKSERVGWLHRIPKGEAIRFFEMKL